MASPLTTTTSGSESSAVKDLSALLQNNHAVGRDRNPDLTSPGSSLRSRFKGFRKKPVCQPTLRWRLPQNYKKSVPKKSPIGSTKCHLGRYPPPQTGPHTPTRYPAHTQEPPRYSQPTFHPAAHDITACTRSSAYSITFHPKLTIPETDTANTTTCPQNHNRSQSTAGDISMPRSSPTITPKPRYAAPTPAG